jgi:hypothetical protein
MGTPMGGGSTWGGLNFDILHKYCFILDSHIGTLVLGLSSIIMKSFKFPNTGRILSYQGDICYKVKTKHTHDFFSYNKIFLYYKNYGANKS